MRFQLETTLREELFRGPRSKESRRLAVTQEVAGANPVGPPADPVAQMGERQLDALEVVGSKPTWIIGSSSSDGRASGSQPEGRGIVPHLDHPRSNAVASTSTAN